MSTKQGTGRVAATGRPPATPGTEQASFTRAQRLAREAAEAAELRRYQHDPDVLALRVERVRAQVDRLCWAGIVLGLAFTMTNVQHFAAAGADAWSLPWLAAWLLDPMVSLVLLAILRAEQVTARYQVRTGWWVRAAKWLALAATYVMNTWQSYAAGSPAGIVLHSVPPLMVFAAAEAVTDLRDKLTEAATVAFTHAAEHGDQSKGVDTQTFTGVHEPGEAEPSTVDSAGSAPERRKSFHEYLAEARQAWHPGVVVTAAWIREVTTCSRGLSPRLAAALAAEVDARDSAQEGGDRS